MPDGNDDCTCPVVHAPLSVNAAQMKFDRAVADHQHLGNALVAQAARHQANDLLFPPRQGHQRRGGICFVAALVSHGVYYSPNSMALKIMLSALAEP